MTSNNMVVEIEWTEYDRSWGQRLDGFTYYWTMDVAKIALDEHWENMPAGEAPDIYVRPSKPKFVNVDPVFALLVQGKGKVYSDKSCEIK